MTNTINVKKYPTVIYDPGTTQQVVYLNYRALEYNDDLDHPIYQVIVAQGTPDNIAATPFPIFSSLDAAFTYFEAAAGADLLNQINTMIGFNFYTAYVSSYLDPAINTAFAALTLDTITVGSTNKYFTATEKSKLASLATVASTGSYADLLSKPSIPAAQIQSDWAQATTGAVDFIKNKPTLPSVTRTTSALSLSLVGTGATGTQISSTKDSTVRVTVSTSATATIAGAAVSTVVLKKCATNSSTETDWTSAQTSESSQSYSLAVALQGITGGKGELSSDIPAGWFVKLVNTGSGTHSEGFVSGEKTIYG